MSFDQLDDPLPKELIGIESRQKIIQHFLDTPDDYHRKKDIADAIGYSASNVSDSLGTGPQPGPLYVMGIVEITNREEAMPRYTLADTPVVDFLQEYDGYPLENFFTTRATTKLTKFWLMVAGPDETYTPYKINQITGLSTRGFNNNIETFLESGMVEKEEFTQRTEYSLIVPNDVYESLVQLDELIYETQLERIDELEKQPA